MLMVLSAVITMHNEVVFFHHCKITHFRVLQKTSDFRRIPGICGGSSHFILRILYFTNSTAVRLRVQLEPVVAVDFLPWYPGSGCCANRSFSCYAEVNPISEQLGIINRRKYFNQILEKIWQLTWYNNYKLLP